MGRELIVILNAPAFRGAEISTLEFLKLLKKHYMIRVLIGENSDWIFINELKKLDLKIRFIPMKNFGKYTLISYRILNNVRSSSIIWFPHLGQPLLALNNRHIGKSNFPTLIGHIRDYGLICPVGCINYYNYDCSKCSLAKLIRCKYEYNYKCMINGYTKLITSIGTLSVSFIKGLYEYSLINYAKHSIYCIDGFIAISKFVKKMYISHIPLLNIKPFEVIYNPIIVPEKLIRLSISQNRSHDKNIIVYASGFDYMKGLHVLLEAIRLAVKENPSFKVIYYGKYNNNLIKMIVKRNIFKNFKIMGQKTHYNVLKSIANADIIVLPSIWPEPFGRVAAEANMLGVPVVASNIGGLPEIVENGKTGFLVKPGDPVELAKGIIRALEFNFDREYIHKITYYKFNPRKIRQDFIRYVDKITS